MKIFSGDNSYEETGDTGCRVKVVGITHTPKDHNYYSDNDIDTQKEVSFDKETKVKLGVPLKPEFRRSRMGRRCANFGQTLEWVESANKYLSTKGNSITIYILLLTLGKSSKQLKKGPGGEYCIIGHKHKHLTNALQHCYKLLCYPFP